MRALRGAGLAEVARAAALDDRPFLGVCVGLQMLFEGSDESPEAEGLGVLEGRVGRLPETVKLPQIGWNTVDVRADSRLFAGVPSGSWLYFVHSYAPEPLDGAAAAWCEYGRRFTCAVERGSLWATQFHPEKSSVIGLRLLTNFVRACEAQEAQ